MKKNLIKYVKDALKYVLDKEKTLVLVGVTLALLWFPKFSKAQTRPINQATPVTVIGDFFHQDNIRYATGFNKLDWYGSGDVNNDEKIDSLDDAAIDTASASNYRADVDGNGVPGTPNDKLTLEKYLNGEIPYLPGQWDKLQTPEEKYSWFQKMIPIEENIRAGQTFSQTDPYWTNLQSFINFNGVSDITNYIQYHENDLGVTLDSTANGLFNIPVRVLGLRNNGGAFDASRLTILPKDNPLDVTKYSFYNPTSNQIIPLNEILNYDYVSVGVDYKLGPGKNEFTFDANLVNFVIANNEQDGIIYMKGYILRNSPRLSSINLTAPNDFVIGRIDYENHPDLLSGFYGVASVTSTPPEGQDFYWIDPNLDPSMTNLIKGEIKNEVQKSIVDTIYLNSDSTLFSI